MSQTSFERTGKEDNFVNGGYRDYNKAGEEIEVDDYEIGMKLGLFDEAVKSFKTRFGKKRIVDDNIIEDIKINYLSLTDNTDEGYHQRKSFFDKYIKYYFNKDEPMFTNPESNEAGYINEYWFYQTNGFSDEWLPWDRFLTNKEWCSSPSGYFAKFDYNSPTMIAEVKTIQTKKYNYPFFVIPEKKINKMLASNVSIKYLVLVVIKYNNQVINGRDSPEGIWCNYDLSNFDSDLTKGNICKILRKSAKTNQKDQVSFVLRYNCILHYNPQLRPTYPKAMDKNSDKYKDECNDVVINQRLDEVEDEEKVEEVGTMSSTNVLENDGFLPSSDEENEEEEDEEVKKDIDLDTPDDLLLHQKEDYELLDDTEKKAYLSMYEDGHKHTYILYSIFGNKWRKELDSRIF
jgi:hypothetical protein